MIYIIEGKDGIGKTTLLDNMKVYLKINNITNFKFYREPGGTKIGNRCRELLLDDISKDSSQLTQLMLVIASRNELYELILTDISKGNNIIIDRGILSTYFHQFDAINKNTKSLLFSIQPNIKTDILYLDGNNHNIDNRLNNNWLDYTTPKFNKILNTFNKDIHNHKFINLYHINVNNKSKKEMLYTILDYINT